jgi:CubicO group peptidase (beta-lactamase class C family)
VAGAAARSVHRASGDIPRAGSAAPGIGLELLAADAAGADHGFDPVCAEGGLWSCVQDLALWISFQLRAYTGPAAESPVLATASLWEMHKPRYLADDEWTSAWGISWCADRRDDVSWIQHSGGLPGFTTSVCFDPRQQIGAIVLHNGPSFRQSPGSVDTSR